MSLAGQDAAVGVLKARPLSDGRPARDSYQCGTCGYFTDRITHAYVHAVIYSKPQLYHGPAGRPLDRR